MGRDKVSSLPPFQFSSQIPSLLHFDPTLIASLPPFPHDTQGTHQHKSKKEKMAEKKQAKAAQFNEQHGKFGKVKAGTNVGGETGREAKGGKGKPEETPNASPAEKTG
ncbi:hypothetical protein J010_04129 [Cryptococcus neoformans]|uniref:Uncharacterized protein n=1 Tax=Cryptococcus neoformans Tu259-1 TaxID=1230072 RepID=A0A854QER1_CRYNE|nr:hypothetical protein C353_04223 [Cryptococcus neoformans var. grubii AD1-83a]OWZ53371.1 hypothetical protein C368_04389 [Cryptococcus neoformans var. grubii 125.91]OXG18400.1 hypothetical protein C361_04523 [Cryptococcus neoformans var. grubii Tu259-1]OXG48889.1 hypothetical protein C355_04028 [Cryptococcus neoformans var. grubii Th84]OXG56298.1 hypothetical protein C354_04158 [Cryptococcus neoformans var. grubii MW-RSA1955]OXG60125.1 hypothetical protein C352_04160 [Cryptococcus neoformans